ncbi:MAG: ABC transporter permease [Gemmatimonadota bacterium]
MSELPAPTTDAPSFSRRLLILLLKFSGYGAVVHDLEELFVLRSLRDGAPAARRWYRWQCIATPLRLGWFRFTGNPGPRRSVRPSSLPRAASLVDALATDGRRAARRLIRQPGYAIASVLTIGIGVAAIASVYSIANWMLLRPVPAVRAPHELATIQLEAAAPFGLPISNPDYLELKGRLRSAPDLAGYTAQQFNLAFDPASVPERTAGELVTPDYFATLGVALAAGRAFDASNATAAGGLVAVISDRLWQKYWNRSPTAIGARVTINGQPFTVVGVTPRSFHGAELPGRAQLWVPAGAAPALLHSAEKLSGPMEQLWQTLIARIPTAQGQRAAEGEFNRLVEEIRGRKGPSSFLSLAWGFKVHPGIGLQPLARASVRHTLNILLVSSLLFLLLTCANVSNLGLTRALSLSSATAVQRLLGAPLGRVIRERLVETTIVGVLGSIVGVVLGVAVTGLVRGAGVAGIELDYTGVIVDGGVVATTAVVAIFAGLLAGLLPALTVRRSDGSQLIRVAHRRDRRSSRIRHGLVIAQVALSTTLVVGSGLLARTLTKLRHIDLGFSAANVLAFTLDPESQGLSELETAQLIDRLLDRLRQDQRVTSASISHALGVLSDQFYLVTVFPRPGSTNERDHIVARSLSVSPSFLPTLGVGMVGPGFPPGWLLPDSTAEQVGVLNETALHQLLPGIAPEAAIGHIVQPLPGTKPIRVVGVARDARLAHVTSPTGPYIFRPWSQGFHDKEFTVYLRTTVPPEQMEGAVRDLVRQVDPMLPVYALHSLESQLDDLFAEQRLVATLGSLLGAVGVILAALGLYALLGQSVLERRREIGIRLALGARQQTVVASIIGGGLGMTAVGMVAGLAGAAYLSKLIASRLFGVAPLDLATYAGGSVLLLVAALGACGIPARRASKVEIVEALRAD